ncbi:hypothetical protein KFE25_003818 [Diacronema lutheri]|uniref:Ankyrin repeat domain-containing protein n=1 Tax=Diacronema lutheri TaxID=2081491 RepID=A0A8J5XI14_DIALT|nr:hypothetical protein KFE25_003818 [Diacronema lutheri]
MHGFPKHPAGSIAEALSQSSAPPPLACALRRSERHGLLAVLTFETIAGARNFRARWEGQRFPAAPVDRFEPGTGAPDRLLRVRNGAQQLFAAALHGQREGVETLLGAGVSPDAYRDEFGCTALHMAARCGSRTIVERLLDARAELDVASTLGRTPLAEASAGQHAAVVEALVAAGARVAHLDRWGRHAALAGVVVPERMDGPWRSEADMRIAQILLDDEMPTAAGKRAAVVSARVADAAAGAIARRREALELARADEERVAEARAFDALRRRELECRRAVDPTVPQKPAQFDHLIGFDGAAWHRAALARADAEERACAPGAAARELARRQTKRAHEAQRALWLEGMRAVNPEAGRHALGRVGTANAPRAQSKARSVPDGDDAHRRQAARIFELGTARSDALREAAVAAIAARREEATETQLALAYANPITGARSRDERKAVQPTVVGDARGAARSPLEPSFTLVDPPTNDLVWCERDGWVAKGVPRANRAAFYARRLQ